MKKIILVSALCLGLVFCLVILFLPALLSSDFVLHKILDRINSRPGMTLGIKDFNIGWRQGLRCDGIVYSDSARGLRVTVDRVQGDRGLLALLAAPKKLGAVRVMRPELDLLQAPEEVLGKSPATTKSSVDNKSLSASRKRAAEEDVAVRSTPFWEDFAVRVVIEDGRVIVHNKKNVHNQKGLQDVPDGKIALTSSLADGTIQYKLQWQGGAQGELFADGYINLPARQQNILDTLVAGMRLTLKQFQLAPILALAGRGGKVPVGKGILDGEVTLTGAGIDKLDVRGNITATDLELSGGALGADHPRFDRLSLQIDGGKKDRSNWFLTKFSFDGDPGRIEGSGHYAAKNSAAQLKGSLQLPFFFSQFPHLFKLQKNALIKSGELIFDAGLTQEGKEQQIHLDATAEQVAGVLNKRPFSWGRAATVSLVASRSAADVIVDNLELTTSFARLKGKGRAADFSLDGSVDLAKADQQIGSLFSLPWSGVGRVAIQAGSKLTGTDLYQMNFKAQSAKLSLAQRGKNILPASPLMINGKVLAPAGWLHKKGQADIAVDGSLWPGTFSVSATGVTRKASGLFAGYDLSTDLKLERLSRLLHNLGSLPATTNLSGRLRATAAGHLAGKTIALRELDASIKSLVVTRGTTSFREDNLLLQTKKPVPLSKAPITVHKLQVAATLGKWQDQGGAAFSSFDMEKQRIVVHDVLLRSSLANLDIHALHVANLRQALKSWQADLSGRIDLARLNALLPAGSSAEKGIKASGQGTFVLKADQQKSPYPVSLDFSIPKFRLVHAGKTIFSDQKVNAVFRSSGLLSGPNPVINTLQMNTPPLSLQAKGKMLRAEETTIALKGKQTVDFAAVGKLIKTYTGLALDMRGRRQQDFDIQTPLGAKVLAGGRFSSSLWMEKFSYTGIEAGPLTVPVSLAGGNLKAAVQGVLNDGRINFDTTYHLTAKPANITMPAASRILTDVRIDRPLADGVLAKIHPLFGILARPSGSVSGIMDNFYWPMAKAARDKARFSVVFDVSKVALDSRGVLQEVLRLLGVADQTLTLKESEITCTGQKGRIGCTPVRVLVADSEMTISGSVGMDQSLDYLLEIPITEKLIGREGARILEGTTIKVPIRGTLKKPDFNRNMITDALSDLAGQAAKKAIKDQVKKLVPELFKGLKF